MTDLIWEQPPATKGRYGWFDIGQALKARPGEWAMIGEFPLTVNAGAGLRSNKGAHTGDGIFQTRTALASMKIRKVWARWVPTPIEAQR